MRNRRLPPWIAAAAAAALALTACGGEDGTPSLSDVSPLTGLPAEASKLQRPPLIIKIDNVDAARPQTGLQEADIVFEEPVEGGLTRLAAVYQSKDAATVGPVRSARVADVQITRLFGGGLLAFSGASAPVYDQVRAESHATLLTPGTAGSAFRRDSARRAPHNTFTSTPALYEAAESAGTASTLTTGPLFDFSAKSADGTQAGSVTVRFPATTARWTWDDGAAEWTRNQNGTPARLTDGAVATAHTVIVMQVREETDPALHDVLGSLTPGTDMVGSGAVWVSREGKVTAGTWNRGSLDGELDFADADGTPITLEPGRTWIELLPAPASPTISE